MAPHHIAAMLMPSWGHTGSYIQLAIKLLHNDPTLVVTMVQHNIVVGKMETELENYEHDRTRLRVIGVGAKNSPFAEAHHQLFDAWDTVIIHQLAKGSAGWPKPQSLHLDLLSGGFVIEHTKRVIGPDCKILCWTSMALSPLTEDFFDFDIVPVARKIHSDEELRRGRSMDEILEQVAMANNGSDCFSGVIVKHPGSPDMYDYETVARGAGPSSTTGFAHQSAAQQAIKIQMLAKAVDGWIVPTSICLEPVGVPYWREYFKKHGQELFTVGPQALGWLDTAPTAPTNPVVHAFLESSLSQFGAKSVLYISFGSIAFPAATPDLVTALVDTLLALEPRFPFIFALGNEIAALSSELTERVHLSGKGLICDFWVEQRAILQHAAVGWFLTHGGYNSLTEGLCQGIPLIMWPVFAEQPLNAALFSSGPNPVAFELMQIRTGTQCAPSLRGGPAITGTVEDALAEFRATFEAARGARGAALQENAEIMARALQEARAGEFQDALTRLARF